MLYSHMKDFKAQPPTFYHACPMSRVDAGYEEKLGVPARHFKLTMKTPSALHPDSSDVSVVYVDSTVDYWDTSDKVLNHNIATT